MYPKKLDQLKPYLLIKGKRYVDILIWHLHINGKTNSFNSLGLHEDILNCKISLNNVSASSKAEFKNECELLKTYLQKCDLSLTPNDYIKWIDKKNLRQCNFIWQYIKRNGQLNDVSMLSDVGNMNKYDVTIKALDRLPKNEDKRKLLVLIRKAWEKAISYNGWRYEWLDIKNDLQCEKVIQFLNKPISSKSQNYSKPWLVVDDHELSNYYKFLASVDIWTTSNETKMSFYKKITDAARKWKTPQQKKAQIILKRKTKESNHVLLKDRKLIIALQSIQKEMKYKSLDDALKYIIEKETDISKQKNEQVDIVQINKVAMSSFTQESFDKLREKASSQLRTLCDYSIKLKNAGILDNKMNKDSKKKAKELFKDKEKKLFEGLN
tara:strand:+ start:570 stop:1712 length:1143 start_codon:yes stop_codon:yes gene_type:complete